jgi:hypothetical protein
MAALVGDIADIPHPQVQTGTEGVEQTAS